MKLIARLLFVLLVCGLSVENLFARHPESDSLELDHAFDERPPYFEKTYYSEPLLISDAILDKNTGFFFIKLTEPYEENGNCAAPSSYAFQHIAYPLTSIQGLLDSRWHALSVSYRVQATSVQYIPNKEKRCSSDYESKELFTTTNTPDREKALLVYNLVVLFPTKDNRTQWVNAIERAMKEMKTEKLEKIKKLGGGEIYLKTR